MITGTGCFYVDFSITFARRRKKVLAKSVSEGSVGKIKKRHSGMRPNPASGVPHNPLSRHTQG